MVARSLWCVVASLVVAGCGGSSPEEKCQDLIDTTCERLSSCLGVPSQKDDCIRGAAQSLSCSAATSVAEGYDLCMDELDRASCDALVQLDSDGNPVPSLPASCHAVILVGRLGRPGASLGGIGDAAHVVGL
jgi:hypothetical protein